jgi:hypothetical protein
MGNCLEKNLSDDSEENSIIESTPDLTNSQSNLDMQQSRAETERSRRSHRQNRRHSSSRHMQINDSSSSFSSSGGNRHHHHHNRHHHHHHNHDSQHSHRPFSQSLNFGYSGSSNSFMSSSLPTNGISSNGFANLMSNNNNTNGSSSSQVYYLAPNVQRTADQLTEEEQIKLLKRMTLIQVE